MGLVNLPHNPTGLRDGVDDNKGSAVLDNDIAIVAVVNGGLDRNNMSPTPDLPGTMISATPGERVPSDRIENDAIGKDQLKDDPTTGHADAAVNSADHVRDGILNGLKLVSATVGTDRLKVGSWDWTPGNVNLAAGGDNSTSTTKSALNVVPLCVVSLLSGAPNTTTAKYNVGLHLNTATNLFHIVVQNANDSTVVTLNNVTFRFYYIEIAST